ncbi:hypothetical protein VTL71DRAFT_15492 [Oculimacula yallundae]|uniref:F-box domain-containing protein n=1 Tax=Oculimacula yallundae TaxID=86028 RepID=A0ABR4CJ33_9HELO
MELTPIRIPGKYKRIKTKIATEARKALNRKPGRPLKHTQNVSSIPIAAADNSQPLNSPKKRTLKTIKSKRKMSLLEKLPVELLERVFQFCLNLDLPQASPVLAGKLASATIYNWTLMRVFGPSWDRGYARQDVADEKKYEVTVDSGEWGEEDGELQSRVLRCRWASLEVLLRAKEVWVRRFAEDRVFDPHYFLKERNLTTTSPDPDDPKSDVNSEPLPNLTNIPPPYPTPFEYLQTDYTDFLHFTSFSDGSWPFHTISWSSHADLSPALEIPHSLLSSPFTFPKLQFLFYLLKHGARISWLLSTSGEVALSGLRDAIREGCVQAVHLLVWSGLVERLDGEMLRWVVRNAGVGSGVGGEGERERLEVKERVRTVNQILRLGYTALGSKERGILESELLDLRDEAVMGGDEEGVEYVRRIVESETLRGKIDIRV